MLQDKVVVASYEPTSQSSNNPGTIYTLCCSSGLIVLLFPKILNTVFLYDQTKIVFRRQNNLIPESVLLSLFKQFTHCVVASRFILNASVSNVLRAQSCEV